ncbi:MAG: hypothetical protein V7765_19950 [Oleispira sp.]
MIGWRVVCTIDEKEVVAEVASQPTAWIAQGDYSSYTHGLCFMVLHENQLHQIYVNSKEKIKVVEKK